MRLIDTYLVEAESEAGAVMATVAQVKSSEYVDEYIEKYLTLTDMDIGVSKKPSIQEGKFVVTYYIPTDIGYIHDEHMWAVQIFKEYVNDAD